MGTTLSNGVYLPDEGERNCYAGLKVNWEILNQKVADIRALQLAIAGALHREIVESLPTTDIDPNTIYMVLSGTSATENVYNEFMYVNNAWELIGTSATDLTNYYTKSEVDGKLLLKANASDLTSHTGDTTIHVTASDKTKWTNSANTVVLRLAKTALTPSSSTNAFSNLDDATALKVGDKVMDTAGVLFEVTAIDTANSTFTIGTSLIDLAQDSSVMHLSGDETAGGKKVFGEMVTFGGSYLGNEASTNGRTDLVLESNRDTHGQSGLFITKFRQNKAQGAMSGNDVVYLSFDLLENSVRTNAIFRFNFRDFVNDVPQNIAFYPTGLKNHLGGSAEGSSNNKWHSFNGINPGSLSLPDLNNGIDISGYLTAGNSNNSYTPPANGWISVSIGIASGGIAIFLEQGDMKVSNYSNTGIYQDTDMSCFACMPVVGGVTVNIGLKGANNYIRSAKFFPCQGNV